VVFGISLATKQFGRPPYSPLLTTEGGTVQLTLHLSNYLKLFTDPLYVAAYLSSIRIALIATVITLFIGYPMAYAIARAPDPWRNILLMLVILPFWTSFLLRVYALSGFMRGNGVINQVLAVFGIEPLVMMQTDFAVYVGIVYTYLPFMILPLYTTLVKLDTSLLEASADLGSRPWQTFLSVTLPLSLPGIIAGSMLVFIPAIGEFVIPSLLGGPADADDRPRAVGRVLRRHQLATGRRRRGRHAGRRRHSHHAAAEGAGCRGREGPVDAARLVPPHCGNARLRLPLFADHFAGGVLVQREQPGDGVVGLFHQVVRRTVRRPADAGRRLAEPEDRLLFRQLRPGPGDAVRRGAGALQALPRPHRAGRRRLGAAGDARRDHRPRLLLLFVAMESTLGWPAGRGIVTIIIAHTTFCMAYITVVVQSRLSDLDLSLEEAAMDLGATPFRVFFDITLPIIAPALISGWLLGFTLSLDDLVIASFVSGPGSSTLPMVIFSKVKLGVSPDVNALATIIIGVVALGVVAATIIGLRGGKQKRA
jgi:ABC-type spermidine/putrescine transport system permease subunit I